METGRAPRNGNQCVMEPQEGRCLLKGRLDLRAAWDTKCPDMLDLARNTGLLFCNRQHHFCSNREAQLEVYAICGNVRLAPELRRHVVLLKPGFKGGGYRNLAVHL